MTRERIWGRGSSELSVVCGFSWLRAIGHGKHEAAPLDPNTKHGFFDAAGAAGREREPRGAGAPKAQGGGGAPVPAAHQLNSALKTLPPV
jgi:hypothetical protein